MGTFSQTLRLESLDGERSVEIDALVDTGASYTLVPANLLAELGVVPFGRRTSELADGRRVTYDIGRAVATVDGYTEATLVLFGEDGTLPLLGAYTLEGMGLVVDPAERRLLPGTNYHL